MNSSRYRIFLWAGLALVLLWGGVFGAYRIAEGLRPTPEKMAAYAGSLDLDSLAAEERRLALEKLARQLNGLAYEDRREVRMGRDLERLFEQMTDPEKAWFVEQTLPTGVRQMLDAFEALPEEQRRKAVEDSLRRLREARAKLASNEGQPRRDNPVLTEEMQRRVVEVGMKTFYSESSAETKAELAPVLEEMQRLMESGRWVRRRRR